MPLQPGTTLGPYEVTAKIGEGGMGEVYRARDTKLDWDVALKVLPQAFTDDPDRLARFEREAKVLASLNHPQHRTHLRAMTEPSVDRIKPTPPSLRDQGRFLRIEKANQGPIPTATQKESRPRFTEVGPLNLTQRRV